MFFLSFVFPTKFDELYASFSLFDDWFMLSFHLAPSSLSFNFFSFFFIESEKKFFGESFFFLFWNILFLFLLFHFWFLTFFVAFCAWGETCEWNRQNRCNKRRYGSDRWDLSQIIKRGDRNWKKWKKERRNGNVEQ